MKNKLYLRHASVLLAALTLVSVFASCASGADDKSTPATDAPDTQAGTAESVDPNDRSQIKDGLPDGLDLGGDTFTVLVASPGGQNNFIGGVEESSGDVVEDAVLARNAAVEDRLNLTLSYDVHTDLDGTNIDTFVSKLLMSGDNTHDVYTGHQWGLTKLILNGGMVSAEELIYLDTEQPWWWKDYMDELSLGGDRHYFLVGDFFLHALRSARVVLYNKSLYANYYDDADGLYAMVMDNTWTLDRMTAISKDVYMDLNNNGVTDEEDQLGFISWSTQASTDPFVYGSDIEYVKRDQNGYIVFDMISEDAVTLCEKLVTFFWQEGTYTGCTSDAQQAALYSGGKVLFMGNATFVTVENLRGMEDAFGILPYPKFDEAQTEYRSLVHDAGYIGVVNGNSANLDIAGAVLEALCAETYRTVTPVYYETALKVKYSRDDTSAQMIDLIHDSLTTNFIYAYNYALENIGLQYRTLVTKKSTDYVSQVEKTLKSAQKKLDAISAVFAGEA